MFAIVRIIVLIVSAYAGSRCAEMQYPPQSEPAACSAAGICHG